MTEAYYLGAAIGGAIATLCGYILGYWIAQSKPLLRNEYERGYRDGYRKGLRSTDADAGNWHLEYETRPRRRR